MAPLSQQLKRGPLGGGNMRLRDWSGRRVAAMWMIAAAIEALIIAVAAIHPIVVDTRERTSSVMPVLPPRLR